MNNSNIITLYWHINGIPYEIVSKPTKNLFYVCCVILRDRGRRKGKRKEETNWLRGVIVNEQTIKCMKGD